MSLEGKRFQDRDGNEIVVESVEGKIAHLNTGNRVAVERLTDSNYYTEAVNPDNFFSASSNLYSSLAEKLKSTDLNNIKEDPTAYQPSISFSEPVVESHQQAQARLKGQPIVNNDDDIERKKREMAENYLNMQNNLNKSNSKMVDYLDESDRGKYVNRNLEGVTIEGQTKSSSEDNYLYENTYNPQEVANIQKKRDPIYDMFSKVKRTSKFSLNVKLDEKIPKKEFMKMWEESYEVSIIDYLIDEFTEKLLKDPKMIKEQLKEALYKYIYGVTYKQYMEDNTSDEDKGEEEENKDVKK